MVVKLLPNVQMEIQMTITNKETLIMVIEELRKSRISECVSSDPSDTKITYQVENGFVFLEERFVKHFNSEIDKRIKTFIKEIENE